MKNSIKIFILILMGCIFFAQDVSAQVKQGHIKLQKSVFYDGDVLKKSPMGNGCITINDGQSEMVRITGDFNGYDISNANIHFYKSGAAFKGNASYINSSDARIFTLNLKEGDFYADDKLVGSLDSLVIIKFVCNSKLAALTPVEMWIRRLGVRQKQLLPKAELFAGSTKYEVFNEGSFLYILEPDTFRINEIESSATGASTYLLFDNGVKVGLGSTKKWTRPNGDYVVISSRKGNPITKYKLSIRNGIIGSANDYHLDACKIEYTFPNGNKFEGYVKPLVSESNLLDPNLTVNWEWDEFIKFVYRGTLTYADGTFYKGTFSTEGKTYGDKLAEYSYWEGDMYNAQGILIDKYLEGKNSAQREAIKKARIAAQEAAEQEKKEAEQKKLEDERKQKQLLYNKYGKKYVDAIVESHGHKIPVGTPYGLLMEFTQKEPLLDTKLILRLEVDDVNSKCFRWHCWVYGSSYYEKGYILVKGGYVTKVVYD